MGRPRRRTARDQRRRRLSQNFLHHPRAIERVVDVVAPAPDDLVVELCAGTGALTRHVAAQAGHTVAVELDERCVGVLRREVGHLGNRVEVVQADALTVPFPTTPFRVVSNLAFGIGTRLLRRLLSAEAPLRDATVVLQLEAARRLVGEPATSRFSLTWAPWFEAATVGRIGRGAFRPVPAVDAGIVTVRPRPVPWLSPARFGDWDRFVSDLFGATGANAAQRVEACLGRRAVQTLDADLRRLLTRPPSRVPADAWVTVFRVAPAVSRAGRDTASGMPPG